MPRPALLLTIGPPDSVSRVPYAGHLAFALGFRPFYLLAALAGLWLAARVLFLRVLQRARSVRK
ncbi:hypothetical protein [Ralstonia flaminis]|jgi:uncharacterized protein involved in response to NO|uniref:Transmembrane protein n=1 Tax=Ralstonia flaminis TaxID=3058597 RepID=A0ABM9K4D7_9RALS|nr:hypothetical protein [Ralstonia sp. LMG 18101]CAJ0813129.1 hypothetical protein LMG18101_01801 [Ralstonia sp. LMG 18101]